jgi:hypothetical protein
MGNAAFVMEILYRDKKLADMLADERKLRRAYSRLAQNVQMRLVTCAIDVEGEF